MDPNSAAESIGHEFVTAWNAPVPFLAALIPVGLVIWWLINREYRTRLCNAESTIALLKERLDRGEKGEILAIAAAKPALEAARAPTGPRVFAGKELTPASIMKMLKSMTELQARKVLSAEFGKWMKVEGPISGVSETLDHRPFAALHIGDEGMIFCTFAKAEGMESLQHDDTIKVVGRFTSFSGMGVWLDNCELAS